MRAPVAIGVATLLLGVCGAVRGEIETTPGMSLKGLHSVRLLVNNASGWDDVDAALLVIEPEIQTKLRAAGLRLLSEDEWMQRPSAATLEVSVRVWKTRGSLTALEVSAGPDPQLSATDSAFLFLVGIRLGEEVQLPSRTQKPFFATTWSWEGWLGTERKRPFKGIRADVLRGIDDFIGQLRRAQKEP